jgi:hypothetical protein
MSDSLLPIFNDNKKLLVYAGKFKTTPTTDTAPKPVNCLTYQDIYKSSDGERFLGETLARQYLKKHRDDADAAWSDIRTHRNTYKGLHEPDRNAEHYLYALSEVRKNSYAWGKMHVLTLSYHEVKFYENFVLGEHSQFKGSPPTIDELKAGFSGTNDGFFGVK